MRMNSLTWEYDAGRVLWAAESELVEDAIFMILLFLFNV